MKESGTILIELLTNATNKFGHKAIEKLIEEMEAKDKNATGNLSKSYHYELTALINQIQLEFSSEEYLKYIESGRKKGTYPPIQALKAWCKVRGITDKSAPFAIQKSIYNLGIRPVKLLADVFSKNTLNELSIDLGKNYTNPLENWFKIGLENELLKKK